MRQRQRSPAMVGRDAELQRVVAVLARDDADEIRCVLVSGDAGIGKTRLVDAVVDAAAASGAATAIGRCVQLGDTSLPLVAVVDALDQLRRQADEAPDPVDGGMFTALDEVLHGGSDAPRDSGRLVEHVFSVLVTVSRTRRVLLVVEDAHWADATTRDLVAVIGHSRRRARLTVLVTYRADEIHAGHPLRSTVRALSGVPAVEHVRLGGLDRDAAATLVHAAGGPAGADRIAALLGRTGGNPLYLQELAEDSTDLPASLAELFLDRVADLTPTARAVLRCAAVSSDALDEDVLADVTGLPVEQVVAGLREAVEHQVLVLDSTACRFRHALIREAVYENLLPGERARVHRGHALALSADPDAGPGRRALIAHHWRGAHDLARELVAQVDAAREATRVNAYGDAAAHYERTLAIWDEVPDAAGLLGLDEVEVLTLAAEAVQTHDRSPRAVELAQAALDRLGPAGAVARRVRALELLGRAQWTLHHGPASIEAYRRAATEVAAEPPSSSQAVAYSSLGQSLMLRNRYTEALEMVDRAIAVARDVGDHEVHAQALCTRGPSLAGLGRVEEGLQSLRQCLELAAAHGFVAARARGYTNLLHCLHLGGRHAEVERTAPAALDFVTASGHARHYGEAIAGNVIASLLCAGRFEQAAAVHDDPRIPNGDAYQELRWFPILLATGRTEEAERLGAELLEATAETADVQFRAAALLGAARLAAARGVPLEARTPIDEALAITGRGEDQFYAAAMVSTGLDVELDVLWSAPQHTGADQQECRRRAVELSELGEQIAARGVPLLPATAANLATARALSAAVRGDDDVVARWRHAVQQWDDIGQPLERAVAEYRLAEVLLRAGDTAAARVVAQSALDTAVGIGAHGLIARVGTLARRGRLALAGVGAGDRPERVTVEPAPGHRSMTGREDEVLRLVARGRTNRQIGEELFISEKTASVHVSNVMRKLGARNRAEAAAIAGRIGLVDPTGGSG